MVSNNTGTRSRTVTETLLEVRELRAHTTSASPLELLNGVSFSVARGEICGLIGETGSGKSLTAWSVLGLLPRTVRVSAGSIRFDAIDLLRADAAVLEKLRGNRVGMVVQNPQGSLDPMRSIGAQLANMVRVHRGGSRHEADERARSVLAAVGLPTRVFDSYPHQLSGGMAQRAVIAISLINGPQLLIADEPTTGLDVTVQAEVLDLLREAVRETGTSVLLITHDLGIVAHFCDRVAVMYAGKVVEETAARTLFDRPEHPYTRALIAAAQGEAGQQRSLGVPAPADRDWESHCEYSSRCPFAADICQTRPPLDTIGPAHTVLCHRPWRADAADDA